MINYKEFVSLAIEKKSDYAKWTESQFNRWVAKHGPMDVSTAKSLFKHDGDCKVCEETRFGCVLKQSNDTCKFLKELKANGFKRKNCNDSCNQS